MKATSCAAGRGTPRSRACAAAGRTRRESRPGARQEQPTPVRPGPLGRPRDRSQTRVLPRDGGRTSAAEAGGKKIGPTEASPRAASTDPAAARVGTSTAAAGTSEEPTGTRRVPVGSRSVPAKIGGARLVGGTSPEDGEPGRRGAGARVAGRTRMTEFATFDRRAAQEKLLVEG